MAAEGLGQLLCVGVRGGEPGDPVLESDLDVCARAGVGAVILFDVDVPARDRLLREGTLEPEARRRARRNVHGPEPLRRLVSHLRERLGEDLLVTIDQEGGRVARLSAGLGFRDDPSAARFARLDAESRRSAARAMASQLRAVGIDLNFAPCVDLALDPANEIIVALERSFGADPDAVIEAARIVVEAHLGAGVGACLKHFPGHGSSRGDTHRGAVEITRNWQRDAELAPYRELAGGPGVAVMVAHVLHRGLDDERPASLSPAIIGGLLRQELGFEGVVVTDSIDMRAIADRWSCEEATVLAIAAGADLVIDGVNLEPRGEHPAPGMVRALERAIDDGSIPGGRARVEASLERLARLRAEIAGGATR